MLETTRLTLRRFSIDDAEFILELVNDPSFVRHIGDKGVRTKADACQYILTGPIASYERFGFGLFVVELKDGRELIEMCGLLKTGRRSGCSRQTSSVGGARHGQWRPFVRGRLEMRWVVTEDKHP